MASKHVGEAPRADREHSAGIEQERYDNRAFPADQISSIRREEGRNAFDQVSRREHGKRHGWEEVGPFTPRVAAEATYTGRETDNSGRVTSLAISSRCEKHDCTLLVGAAGGGIWRTDGALDDSPDWEPSSDGIPSNAIGSLLYDPTDATGRTLYAGTGEPNGSSDSEAGVGLYQSTDGGRSWSLVPGSLAVARDRSIAAIAVDPLNARHLFIGTAVARHGSSSVNGGRFTPPGAAAVGVYESTNGGATFSLVFSKTADPVDPTSPTGGDFFRGGVSKMSVDRTGIGAHDPTRLYVSLFDYGLFRSTAGGSFEQVFASAGGGTIDNSLASRTEFALAPMGNKLRIYVGDVGGGAADFYRVDNAGVAANTLTDGVSNPGWMKLSNAAPGTPGFGSYNYCSEQCSYDMPVESPRGRPDVVWIGGQMQYDEIFTATPPSNGRAVQRSTDAGASFTDMTNDTQSPPLGMHPDQHAIAFSPTNPDIAFLGSDGGVVRTSGQFADASADCDGRGISGTDLIDCKAWLSRDPDDDHKPERRIADAAVPERVARRESSAAEPSRRHTGQRHVGVQRQVEVVVRIGRRRRRAIRDRRRQHQYPDAHLHRAAGRREFPGQRSAGLELVGRRAECQRRSRFLLCSAHQRSESRRHLVHRAAARLAHEGQRRQPGVPRTALQRVLRRLHGRVRRLGAAGRSAPAT